MRIVCFFVSFNFFAAFIFGQSAYFEGTVIDEESHEPLIFADVVVSAKGQNLKYANTDKTGNFRVNFRESDIVHVKVSYVGYLPRVFRVNLLEGESLPDTILLKRGEPLNIYAKSPVTLEGVLTDGETGEPILFGTVEVYSKGEAVTGASTDLNGYFKITFTPLDKINVEFSYVGYKSATIGLNLKNGDFLPKTIELFPDRENHKSFFNYKGKVIDSETGQPILFGNVVIFDDKTMVEGAVTDLNGEFEFSFRHSDKITIEASYVGYSTKKIEVNLKKDQTLPELISITPSEIIPQCYFGYNFPSVLIESDAPVSHSRIDKSKLKQTNHGKDMPFILDGLPSSVASSDAGAGVGYSATRLRGSDQTRINVTINGIPLNDSESQGVFWVNTPDLAASADEIVVQRGVGASSLGAGAFGGTVGINTLALPNESSINVSNSIGSFNTRKHSLDASIAIDNWYLDARLSKIASDGYIDRASSDLNSYYAALHHLKGSSKLSLVHFSGKERTYQSWNGVPEGLATGDNAEFDAYVGRNFIDSEEADRLREQGRRYNVYTYEDQVDDYRQDHYRLHFQTYLKGLEITSRAFFTHGEGFFEQFREDDDFATYGLAPIVIDSTTISSGDFVRRRWLDNDFFGGILSVGKRVNRIDLNVGGAWNKYIGDHFGELIYSQRDTPKDFEYYRSDATKTDGNVYLKATRRLGNKIELWTDLQFRSVNYKTQGIDNDLKGFQVDRQFNFFNPKIGLHIDFNPRTDGYFFAGIGNREPDRSDFIDAPADKQPLAENMLNLEAGLEYEYKNFWFKGNGYWMHYQDQLVLNGSLNDVGASLRVNVDNSFRAGIELESRYRFDKKFQLNGQLSVSQNKIKSFEEKISDLTIQHQNTNIAYSPNIIASVGFIFKPMINGAIVWRSKYVGKQYLDNTSNENRSLDPFSFTDLSFRYSFTTDLIPEIGLKLLVSNVFDASYSAFGYTYSYNYNGIITENFHYPQAGTNVIFTADFNF